MNFLGFFMILLICSVIKFFSQTVKRECIFLRNKIPFEPDWVIHCKPKRFIKMDHGTYKSMVSFLSQVEKQYSPDDMEKINDYPF